jgi:hypothetical protein
MADYGSDELEWIEKAREELDRKSQEVRRKTAEHVVQPTVVGLVDPSKPLARYCGKCGTSHAEPFGSHTEARRLLIRGVIVEFYPCGGIILLHECGVTTVPDGSAAPDTDGIVIFDKGNATISTRRSTGLGSSGQLGYTRTVIAPDK